MHRFFYDGVLEKSFLIDQKQQVHQMSRILGLQKGDEIILLEKNNKAEEILCKVSAISGKKVEGVCLDRRKNNAEPSRNVFLILSLPKSKQKYEDILQHAVELGVTHICPIRSERSLAKYPETSARIEKILSEAVEQSERSIIPVIQPLASLVQNISEVSGRCLIADSYNKEGVLLSEVIRSISLDTHIAICIGPEGGFSEKEVALAIEAGAVSVSLGKRVLRTETAAWFSLSYMS